MKSKINKFSSGWSGIQLGITSQEIDDLIQALQDLKQYKTHFHYRSEFEGEVGLGDIEIYYDEGEKAEGLTLENSCRPHDGLQPYKELKAKDA